MFKKKTKKQYDINVYPHKGIYFNWQYDVHFEGKLIVHSYAETVKSAKREAEIACLEHSKSGKYTYEV